MPKVLYIFGVVLLCLHTFTGVKTSPTSRKSSSSLQRSLKRNLTILARAFNVTQKFADYPKRTKLRNHCFKDRFNSGLDLINAPVTNTRKVRLFSRNRYLLQITDDGTVNGTKDEKPTVWFELQSVCVGVVRIKNIATGRYLAMDKHGKLCGRVQRSLETLFVTKEVNSSYHWYRSYKYKKWFVAIRKNGTQKPAHQTAVDQKAVLFIHVH